MNLYFTRYAQHSMTPVLIIFLLLLLNAFFALSELAIVSARKPLLREWARQGNHRAATALKLAEEPGKFLSTVQVGITLVGILAGAYGGAEIADKLIEPFNSIPFIYPHGEGVAVALVVTALTYFSVVIGELIPKQIALSHPEKLALWAAPFMKWLAFLCQPIVFLLEGSANSIMRLLGILKPTEPMITETEVKAVLAEGAASGAIEKSEHEIMQRVIRLGDRDIKSIMTHRVDVTFIQRDDSRDEILRKLRSESHTHYPVLDASGSVMGVIRAKDVVEEALSQGTINLEHHLKLPTVFPETMPCLKGIEAFKKNALHFAVVVDEYGATQGIVTTSDFLEAIIGMLPSNYGQDEHTPIIQRADGSWLLDGTTSIYEIHVSIGLEEIQSDADYKTLAGFMLHTLGKTPEAGDVMEQFGHRFEIVDMDGLRIDKVLISKL